MIFSHTHQHTHTPRALCMAILRGVFPMRRSRIVFLMDEFGNALSRLSIAQHALWWHFYARRTGISTQSAASWWATLHIIYIVTRVPEAKRDEIGGPRNLFSRQYIHPASSSRFRHNISGVVRSHLRMHRVSATLCARLMKWNFIIEQIYLMWIKVASQHKTWTVWQGDDKWFAHSSYLRSSLSI